MKRITKLGFVLILSLFTLHSCSYYQEELELSGNPAIEEENYLSVSEPSIIDNRYIVVYQKGKAQAGVNFRSMGYENAQTRMRAIALQKLTEKGIDSKKLGHIYSHIFQGFSVELTEDELNKLANDPNIAYIEQDAVVSVNTITQSGATWGLDRSDQGMLPLDGNYSYDADGSGVTAYIIDTGIRTGHQEFGNRAQAGFDAIGDGRNGEDCNGHGTHVAGTVGGANYGIAKDVTLVAVRVLNCDGSGSISGVLAGMNWVKGNAQLPAVANMSLGGGSSTSIDNAVNEMYAAGIPIVVAAGNGNFIGREANACNYSPAGAANAYTVGATDATDKKTSWSNYGDCVDIFAPGSGITSAWYTSNTATARISGTSMASPHVAGAAALYLETNATASPADVYNWLTANSTKNIVSSARTTNNHLLYTLGSGGGGNGDPDSEDPSQVTGLTATAAGTAQIDLTWDAATDDVGVVQYNIYRDGSLAGTSTTTSFSDDGLSSGTTYTYEVSAEDAAGKEGMRSNPASATTDEGSGSAILLTVIGYKEKGIQHADLSWSGATTTNVDVYRDEALVTTTANDGSYTDNINQRGGGSYTYRVCEEGTSICSDNVVVNF